MRRKSPKEAKKGRAGYRKNWTVSDDDNVYYRHQVDGTLSFAARTYSKGVRHYRVLQARTWQAARREAMSAQDEAENLPQVRDIPTVREYWEERVKPAIRRGDQSQRTIDGYLQNVDQILRGNQAAKGKRLRNEQGKLAKKGDGACPKHILNKRVDYLDEEDCADWFSNAFLNPYRFKPVNNQWIVWRILFKLAIKDGFRSKMPDWCIDKKKARGRDNRYVVNVRGESRKLEVMDRHQLLEVIEEIKRNGQHLDDRAEDVANVNLLLATTGMRMCELLALRWGDIDFENRVATLEGRLKSNRDTVDYIDLNPWAIKALLRLKACGHTRVIENDRNGNERTYRIYRGTVTEERTEQGTIKLRKSNPCLRPSDYVSPFVSVDRAFANACKRLGYEPQSPHKLRHFFATECAEQGDSWAVIAQHLGHSDGGALAAKTYSHVRRGHVAERAAQWDLERSEEKPVAKERVS